MFLKICLNGFSTLANSSAKSVKNADDFYRFHQNKTYSTLKSVVNNLLTCSEALQEGRFIGTRGISSKIYYGVKGTGKTTVLQSFARFIPLKHPNIVPLYFSFNQETSLSACVRRELKEKAILEPAFEGTLKDVFDSLEKKGLFLLLMADDFECLYQKPPNNEEAIRSLSEIGYLGGNDTGRGTAILCSSSPGILNLMELDSRSSPHELERYPLLHAGIPQMNLTKIAPRGIQANLPNDIRALFEMFNGAHTIDTLAKTAFHTGCNLYSLKQTTFSFENPMKNKLFQKLVEKNRDLLRRIDADYPVLDPKWVEDLEPILVSLDKENTDAYRASKENGDFIDRAKNGWDEHLVYPNSMMELYSFYKVKEFQ